MTSTTLVRSSLLLVLSLLSLTKLFDDMKEAAATTSALTRETLKTSFSTSSKPYKRTISAAILRKERTEKEPDHSRAGRLRRPSLKASLR